MTGGGRGAAGAATLGARIAGAAAVGALAAAPRAATAQLPDARQALAIAAAAAVAAQRDRALSPFRFDGAGAGADLAYTRALAAPAGARLGVRAAYAAAELRPSSALASGRRTQLAGAVQLVALAPVARVGPARVLAGAALDGQGARTTDHVTLPADAGRYRTGIWSAFVTLRPTAQVEAGGRTAVAYAVAPALAGWVWRQYGPDATTARGAFAGPGRLGAVEQAVAVTRALGARTALTAGYRASLWRVRAPGAAGALAAVDQRLTLGVVLRAREAR